MSDDVAIKVEHVSKTFKLPHEKQSSIKGALISMAGGGKRSYETQQVLKDISFDIKKGEFFGIVGRNGSGKSTLLKMLAGIYTPSKGNIQVNGRLTPFIELGVGFSPELTGRENVFLNGALLGFNRKEMEAMYDEIVEFAEIERFMDQKLKNYSSGMQVRLAFSIAIRATSDILLIDEVLAVGDVSFQQKCYDYFEKLKDEKRTIILVTHDMSAVKQFCDRALFIHDGDAKGLGDTQEISEMYERVNYAKVKSDDELDLTTKTQILKLRTLDGKNAAKQKFEFDEDIIFSLLWPKDKKVGIAGIAVYKGNEVVFASNTVDQNCRLEGATHWKIDRKQLGAGRYRVSATIFGSNRKAVLASSSMENFLIYNQPPKGVHDDEWEGTGYLKNEWM